MNIMYATYPMAFHTPGGGEIQLESYYRYTRNERYKITLFDAWKPRFEQHDLVHYFSCVGGSVHFCRFVKDLGIPLIISSSLWITAETKNRYPFEEIRLQLNMADKIVTNSDMESEAISETLGISPERFYRVYNGIDPIFLERPSPEVFRSLHGVRKPYILCVGNIEARKNQHTLAMAMRKFPEHHLILIGHIRDRQYLEKVVNLGLQDQVVYIGPLPHNSVALRSAYQGCDAFCLPSTLETPGLAALEAVAQGRPLAVTEVGSTREYFGEAVAYLDPQDPDSVADAITRAMISMSKREDELTELGTKFTWPKVVARLQHLYEQF
jgi:glycosyltransferase involved in cell wall biosynthesis